MEHDKEQRLHVRMNSAEKKLAKELADIYGLNGNVSEFIRMALMYIDSARPDLTITISPRDSPQAG